MSGRMGLVTYEQPRQPMFLPGNYSRGNTYSEEKSAQIDGEKRQMPCVEWARP